MFTGAVISLFLVVVLLAAVAAASDIPTALTTLDPDAFHVYLSNRQDHGMALKCYTLSLGKTQFREKITLDPWVPQRRIFYAATNPMVVECMYHDFRGSYGRGVKLFDTQWPDLDRCLVKNGGCGYRFERGLLYKLTRQGGKDLLGELPAQDCMYMLFLQWICKERPHRHRLIGRPATRWAYVIGNLAG